MKKIIWGLVLGVALALVSGIWVGNKAEALTALPPVYRDLGFGSYGADVQNLQRFLNSNGYVIAGYGAGSMGHETYYFGALTRNALLRFQAANGVPATGIFDSATRGLFVGMPIGQTGTTGQTGYTGYTGYAGYYGNNRTALLAQIEVLKQRLEQLRRQLAGLNNDDDEDEDEDDGRDPYIKSIKVYNGGDDDYIDTGDYIKIAFSEPIDPESVNDDLDEGDYVTGVGSNETGGFSVSSSGRVTISGIASFDMGEVSSFGTFTSKIALSSDGKTLTITLTNGGDFRITDEDFDNAYQIGGVIEDRDGNEMESDSSIDDPTGSFGGNGGEGPDIESIEVYDGGDDDYIDEGDYIKITFSEPIDPQSVNDDLDEGDYVTGVPSYQIGGVSVSSSGIVLVQGIARFDAGDVDGSESYTVKLALSSNGRTLTITLTDGRDIEIDDEDFTDAQQIGGAVEDSDGNEMKSDSDIDDPSGTFGGSSSDDDDAPYISSIVISNGGSLGQIDVDDTIKIYFSEPIDPQSINDDLDEGDYVAGVDSNETGGVSVDSSGAVTIDGIAIFELEEVDGSEDYICELYLSSDGETLTITLTDGNDVEVEDDDFGATSQTGGVIEDRNGNEMENDSSIDDPTGRF